MAEKLTLASMCAGGVQERIDRALAKISDNILDLNTDAKKKRTLDIKIVLTPSEDDREDVAVEVQTSVMALPVPCLRQTEAHGRMRRKPTSKRISKKNLRMYQTFS